MYRITIYTSRNTTREHYEKYSTLAEARKAAKVMCKHETFPTGDFHDNPINKGKIAITKGRYPDEKYEVWEYIKEHDKAPVKIEWN